MKNNFWFWLSMVVIVVSLLSWGVRVWLATEILDLKRELGEPI